MSGISHLTLEFSEIQGLITNPKRRIKKRHLLEPHRHELENLVI